MQIDGCYDNQPNAEQSVKGQTKVDLLSFNGFLAKNDFEVIDNIFITKVIIKDEFIFLYVLYQASFKETRKNIYLYIYFRKF